MTELNPEMIADLARLAVRYSPDDWEQLTKCLEDRRARTQLGRLLQELAATSHARSKRSGGRRSASQTQQLREVLAKAHDEDPARAEMLEDMWTKLRRRELLPTLAAVRAFAEAAGLKELGANRREQAIVELIRQLVAMPSEDLEQMMRQTVVVDRRLGEEYERWVRLILHRRGGSASSTSAPNDC